MNEQGLLQVPESRSPPELYSWSTGARVDFYQVRDTSALQLILFTFTVGRNLSDQASSKEAQSFKTLALVLGGFHNITPVLSLRLCLRVSATIV